MEIVGVLVFLLLLALILRSVSASPLLSIIAWQVPSVQKLWDNRSEEKGRRIFVSWHGASRVEDQAETACEPANQEEKSQFRAERPLRGVSILSGSGRTTVLPR